MEYKKIVRSILAKRNVPIDQQINQVKININANEYKDALNSHPLFNKYLLKYPFFRTIEEIFIKNAFNYTGDLKKEFKWQTNIIENFFEEINTYIQYKEKFENYFILEKYDEALEVLKNIENEFGISLWSIEANLMIEDTCNGSEANWNKLSYYLSKIKNSIYEFIINSSSKRVESRLSYDSYFSQFQNDIDSVYAYDIIKDFFVFKNLTIAAYEYDFKNLSSVIYVSNIFSITDQYFILIDVITHNITESNEYDKLFLPFIVKAKSKIKDVRLSNIYNIINNKKELIYIKSSDEILDCLNNYYYGNFQNSLTRSKKGIEDSPLEYEFYEVYCKSLINLQLEFVPTHLSGKIDTILELTFNILTFSKSKEESFKELLKIATLYMNTNFGKQITGLLAEVEGSVGKNFPIKILSASYNSYKNIFFSKTRKQVTENFSSLLDQHCIKVYNYKLGNNVHFKDDLSKSVLQKVMFDATHEFSQNNYHNVVSSLTNKPEIDSLIYYFERKLNLLFYSYLNLNQISDALILFGTVLFDNSFITRKVNHADLFEKIKKISNKSKFISLIEYPILYSLNIREYDLYEAYDDFLSSLEIFHIQELVIDEFIEKFTLEKVVYFMNNVVTIDTLKYSTDYGSISEVEEDRVKVLNILANIDKTNKLKYESEINEIYRVNSVRKVLKEVDEGRLYIDVNSLKEIQIKNFKDDFTRFKEIEVSSLSQSLIGFNSSNTKNWEKALTERNEVNEKFNSADYLAFKSIYLESRENFLFSKEYGLDSCLSTRIRHGALKNHIRSVFEKLDLVTSKLNDKYKNNETWSNQLINYPDLNEKIQGKLKKFSRDIDDYTIFIVEKLIQIQTEKNSDKNEGLFQYFTHDELLFNYYNQFKHVLTSIDATIELILTQLVNYTLINLQKDIVSYFTDTISKKFQAIIDNLIFELREAGLTAECELIPNLMKSSTEIQNELQYLSEWFYLNTTNSSSLLSMETILEASLNLTNRINPLFNLAPEISIKKDFAGYSNLIFVFNILLNNVIKHSNLETDEIKLKIEIDTDYTQTYTLVKFSHNLNSDYDYSMNYQRLQAVKENWNNHENIDRSNKEGESGYDKIKRILIYEALAKTDKFDFIITSSSITISLYFPYAPLNYEKDFDN